MKLTASRDGPSWNFGQLEFKNVEIVSCSWCKPSVGSSQRIIAHPVSQTATGTSTSWCTTEPENYGGRSVYTVTGTSTKVTEDTVTCLIKSLILHRPA